MSIAIFWDYPRFRGSDVQRFSAGSLVGGD